MTVRNRTTALIAAAVMSTLTLSACGSSGDTPSSQESSAASPDQAKPDLAGLPDVVAVVDGADITKADFVTAYESQFQQLAAQAKSSGQPLDQDQLKQQTAESMVNTQLLLAEAEDRGFTASKDDIDATLAELAEQSGLSSPKELLASLAKQGVDQAEAERQLEGQVKLDQLLAEEGGDADPTEKELRKLYDQGVAQQEGSDDSAELPSFDELRPQLEDQLRSQTENTAAQVLVEDLRKGADIKINL